MHLTSLLPSGARVLELGATDAGTAEDLAAHGFERYLGLVSPSALARVRADAGRRADRFHPITTRARLHHSTDVLVLRGDATRQLWSARDLRGVSHLAVEAAGPRGGPEAALARLAGRITGITRPVGTATCAGHRMHVLEVSSRSVVRPRQYLSPVWGVEGLVDRLDEIGVRYTVLRWFEGLPALDDDEDLDVLVDDDDLDRFRALLAQEPGTIPVDLYSVGGLTGADYHGVAYYPPRLAQQIMDGAVRHPSGCRVPAPPEHLRSLAYHAVYHKGPRSGIPSDGREAEPNPEHDYMSVLTSLAQIQSIDLPQTLEGLDAWLGTEGWRPPDDTLRRMVERNAWINEVLSSGESVEAGGLLEPPETAVFLLREAALRVVTVDEVVGVLRGLGFDVIAVRDLGPEARVRAAGLIRGGNWGRGPYPRSGGGPATALVAVHHGPRPPDPAVLARYPRLSNGDVLDAKLRVRDLVDSRSEISDQFNPMHSSDDELEAWEYVGVVLPDELDALVADVARLREAWSGVVPVIARLSRGRRARVDVVPGPQGPVVRKTFAPAFADHMARELQAMTELGPHLNAVPPVLDVGPDWFTSPYYDDALGPFRDGHRLMPLRVVREMVSVLRQVHHLGADLVDARPENFLLDPVHGLRLVDFEFYHRYPGSLPAFHDSYGFAGVPADFDGPVPVSHFSYHWRWRRFTGLPLDVMLDGPEWLQHLHRLRYRLRRLLVARSAAPWQLARLAPRTLRAGRRHLGTRFRAWARRRASGEVAA